MHNRLKINKLLIVFFLSILTGCTTVYNPATGRQETLLYDTEDEVRLGNSLDNELRKKLKLSDEFLTKTRLERIGNKIAHASDRQDLTYYFRAVEDKDLNAFAIPGGFVYVNSGLMDNATDDELACVLGHEIGHVAARHSIKRMQVMLPLQLLIAIGVGLSGQKQAGQLADEIIYLGGLHYSRQDETLADKLAVRYSKRASFNPYGMVTFLEKLKVEAQKQGPDFTPVILRSHPGVDERIRDVKKEIELKN